MGMPVALAFVKQVPERITIDGFSAELAEIFVADDTRYADGYSHRDFRGIEVGMTEQEVLRILGEPLARWKPYGYRRTRFPEKAHYVGLTYSDSPTSKSYRLRQVLLDRGTVAEIRGYFYFD